MSSTADRSAEHPSVEHAMAEVAEVLDLALHFSDDQGTRWRRRGLSPRGERWFDVVAWLVLAVFVAGWGWSVADAREAADTATGELGPRRGLSEPTARITAALTEADAPSAAYLSAAALAAFSPDRGESGKLRAVILDPGEDLELEAVPEGARVGLAPADSARARRSADPDSLVAPKKPGIWQLILEAGNALAPVADFAVITRRPLSARHNGRVGLYFIGTWPTERKPHAGYRTPSGFIEVTPENQDTYVSEHFQLKDFLTHGQENVWPKYLVLDMRLVDKLELVLADLESRGVNTDGVVVMSGFRTPQYNEHGGLTAGRATLSRHMYGDASDIFIDNDGDFWMDDINRDGRRDVGDARYLAAAAERVERQHPSLIGGIGIYTPGPGHGPFVHIDTRGFRARW
ncbi:MAG TPA: hypothetical protein VFS08_05740 [Gemmatimonadaceae bacterium]|nr:hypothetical protein [Gemmatimonadaceae bacterium]